MSCKCKYVAVPIESDSSKFFTVANFFGIFSELDQSSNSINSTLLTFLILIDISFIVFRVSFNSFENISFLALPTHSNDRKENPAKGQELTDEWEIRSLCFTVFEPNKIRMKKIDFSNASVIKCLKAALNW